VPFQWLGLPDQVGGAKRWAELGILEDSCPSNARARPTKVEAQKGGLSRVAWRARALPMPGPARPRWRWHQAPVSFDKDSVSLIKFE
jgi:hypothetical protein